MDRIKELIGDVGRGMPDVIHLAPAILPAAQSHRPVSSFPRVPAGTELLGIIDICHWACSFPRRSIPYLTPFHKRISSQFTIRGCFILSNMTDLEYL